MTGIEFQLDRVESAAISRAEAADEARVQAQAARLAAEGRARDAEQRNAELEAALDEARSVLARRRVLPAG